MTPKNFSKGATRATDNRLTKSINFVSEEVGGKALAVKVDVRDEASVQAAIDLAVKTFGGIDILVNNANAISLTPTAKLT